MRSHSRFSCERLLVLGEVHKHINLSTSERSVFLDQSEADSLACNCGWLKRGVNRDMRTLERLVTDAVLKARGLNARKALEQGGASERERKPMVFDGPEGKLIRIDFRLRRRIIDQ